jgi:hypothetical protein
MQLVSAVEDTTACFASRADIWDVLWASDDPATLAIMEKSKMMLLHENAVEDPVRTSHYLLSFGNLEVLMLDLVSLLAKSQAGTYG